jgi:hypothetical protein
MAAVSLAVTSSKGSDMQTQPTTVGAHARGNSAIVTTAAHWIWTVFSGNDGRPGAAGAGAAKEQIRSFPFGRYSLKPAG